MKNIEFSKEIKRDLIGCIQQFFLKERDEEISEFHAATMLDFIINDIGPYIYNQAIADAHTFMAEMIEDMYGLEKRPR